MSMKPDFLPSDEQHAILKCIAKHGDDGLIISNFQNCLRQTDTRVLELIVFEHIKIHRNRHGGEMLVLTNYGQVAARRRRSRALAGVS